MHDLHPRRTRRTWIGAVLLVAAPLQLAALGVPPLPLVDEAAGELLDEVGATVSDVLDPILDPILDPDGVEGWDLVFEDEFEGNTLDTSVWHPYHNTYGDGNRELPCLQPDNVTVAGGTLRIEARRERTTCPNGAVRDFTSGFLGTRETGTWFPRYARFEIRARLPHAQGIWPAFWLRHREGAGIAEVDVLEYFHAQRPGSTSAALHLDGRVNAARGHAWFEEPTDEPAWHVWAVEITPDPDGIRFVVTLDDEVVLEHLDTHRAWADRTPVDGTWDMAVNLAVGGRPAGHPDDPLGYLRDLDRCAKPGDPGTPPANCDAAGIERASFPEVYEVDRVRVYVPD